MYGSGQQTRSFCYVDDLVDGLLAMMNTPPDVSGPVNLGNPEEVTMQQLAAKVAEIVGVDASIVHEPLPTDDPMQRMPDATLAGRLLGWSAQVPLDKGLEQTVNWFQKQYGNNMAGSP